MMRHFFVALVFLFCFATRAQAEHAIAMHGAPKYAADFQHLDYVNPEAPKGGTLSMAKSGSFDSLNPHIINGSAAEGLEMTNDRLMARVWDEPFTLYGLVAQSIDLAPDRSWVVFHLDPRARFHDGTPMTSADVAFTFDFYKKSGHPVRRRVYSLVSKVTIIDDHTIRFDFGPGYDRESVMILGLMPVLSQKYWQGRDLTKTTLEPPLGSGPYRIAKVDAGRSIVYERVADYWAKDLPVNRGLYNFDRISYTYFRDDDVALQAFKAGDYNFRRETDIARWQTGYTMPKDKPARFVQQEIKHGRPEWLRAFIFNTRRPIFFDVKTRQAIGLMFNAEWINRNFYAGAMRRIDSVFPNSELSAAQSPVPEADERSRRREAIELLKSAGWKLKDKKWVDASGQVLKFEILLGSPLEEKMALEFSRQLKKVGIDVSVRTVDSAQFAGRLEDFDYDMLSFRWINSLSPGNEQLNYWGTAAAGLKGSRNYAGVEDPKIDAAADSIARAHDRAELVQRAKQLDSLLMQGNYFVPLFYNGRDLIAHAAEVTGPEVTPIYGIAIESWWQKQP